MSMPRTVTFNVRIVGGPRDGLRMQVRDRPNGETLLDGGALFFPDGIDHYELDRDARTLTLTQDGEQ